MSIIETFEYGESVRGPFREGWLVVHRGGRSREISADKLNERHAKNRIQEALNLCRDSNIALQPEECDSIVFLMASQSLPKYDMTKILGVVQRKFAGRSPHVVKNISIIRRGPVQSYPEDFVESIAASFLNVLRGEINAEEFSDIWNNAAKNAEVPENLEVNNQLGRGN